MSNLRPVGGVDLARLSRFKGLGIVALGLTVGVVLPEFAWVVEAVSVPLVALLVFATLHGTSVGGYSPVEAGTFTAVVLAFGYLVVPGATSLVAGAFDPAAATALFVVSAAPTTTGSALVWTVVGGGDELLATVGALATLAAAPLAVPAVLTVVADGGVTVPAVPLLRDLAVMIGGGAVLARVVPADRVSSGAKTRLSLVVIFLLMYGSVADSSVLAVDPAALAGVAGVSLGVLATSGGLALCATRLLGWDRTTGIALCNVGALKNLGVSLAVVTTLGASGAGVFVAAFYVAQQLAASALAGVLSGR